MLFLRTVKGEYLVQLWQPGVDATFQHRRLFAPLALAVGNQRATHVGFHTVADEFQYRAARRLHGVPVQVEARIHRVFAETQVAIDTVLHAVALELQWVPGIHWIHAFTGQWIQFSSSFRSGRLATGALVEPGVRISRQRHFAFADQRLYVAELPQGILENIAVIGHVKTSPRETNQVSRNRSTASWSALAGLCA